MGTTCASAHIAVNQSVDEAIKAISKAYCKLGYDLLTDSAQAGKHVVVHLGPNQRYVSVYDSTNALVDNGELKDMALLVSKQLKSAAVVTSVYDSDNYEFVVFANGKQIDLLMSDPQSYSGPLKRLPGKTRAKHWSSAFGLPVSADKLAQAVAKESAFAEDNLASLSELVGLVGSPALMQYQDFLRDNDSITAELCFAKNSSAPQILPDGAIQFANYYDQDNSRMLLVYPASWPIPTKKKQLLTWLVLSQGNGFDGGNASIRLSDVSQSAGSAAGGLKINSGSIAGFKFHNGQIVGPLESRHQELEANKLTITQNTDGQTDAFYTAQFPNLSIPDMSVLRTTQILIVFQLEVQAENPGTWEINVTLKPRSTTSYEYSLPAIRIAVEEKLWLPIVSGLNPKITYNVSNLAQDAGRAAVMLRELKYKQDTVVEDRTLEHTAVTSNVAILSDRGQPTLDACRAYLENWLRPLAKRQSGQVKIVAEKQMTESGSVTKTKKNLPLSSYLDDKAWQKLFAHAGNLQSVLVTFTPNDAEIPIAGIGLQHTLENKARHEGQYKTHYEQQLSRTLSVMRGRQFEQTAHAGTVHLFEWVLNHSDCYEFMDTSATALEQRMNDFAATNSPLQAWHSQNTWIPLFDHANDYRRTVYEESSVLNWFRGILASGGGLNDEKMSHQWCSNVLRMIAPVMWLCPQLIEQVSLPSLEKLAVVTKTNGTYKLALRSGCTLDDLELALLPVLPVESARISCSWQSRTEN